MFFVSISIIPNSRSSAKKSAAAPDDNNSEVSNYDFNAMMDKEFISSVISELTKNMKF